MKQYSDSLLKNTGGWYVIIAISLSQIIGMLGAIPGFVSIWLTLRLNNNQAFAILIPLLVIISQLILLGYSWWFTRNARQQLDEWITGELTQESDKELQAWREITNFTPRYGAAAFFVNMFGVILPLFIIALTRTEPGTSVVGPDSFSSSLPLFILLGGLASVLGWTILTLLVVERLTIQPRLILLPNTFENQIQGSGGIRLGTRFNIMILGLSIIWLAIIVPIGYQQAARVLSSEASSIQVLRDLQFQSIVLSVLILFLGGGFSYLANRSISTPVRELIKTFQKIEQGDLKQRAPVTATDELATVAMYFNHILTKLENLQFSLEQQARERTKQLAATIEVGRVASSILDPDQLLSIVIKLITEQFDYYYAGIYLLDSSGKWAELKEATGQVGNVLKQNHHRLEASGWSPVANCIRVKKPSIAQKTMQDTQKFENPLLPYTRSEIALPLIVGGRVLGALNIQSTKPDDFREDIIETMQNLAGQVAVALENARLFQEARRSIDELRSIQRQYLLKGWSNLRSHEDELEYGIGEPTESATQVLESSFNLRDQDLGRIILERREEWTPELQNLVDAVTSQAAIALENARLVSESRQIAVRERTLAEINSKIWSSPSIDTILQTVVRELGSRLDVSNASIELNLDDTNG